MPIARFQMPDGRIARFQVDEGTSPEDAQAAFDQFVASGAQGNKTATAVVQPRPAGGSPAPSQADAARYAAMNPLQRFLSDKPFDNPVVAAAARGTGLAARSLVHGVTGTSGMLADAGASLANMAGAHIPTPSVAQDTLLTRGGMPTPDTFGEKARDFAGSIAAGSMADPLARAMTAAMPPAGTPPALTPRQQTILEAQQHGAVVTPSQGEGGVVGNFLEGFARKPALEQAAKLKNQANFTDRLMRQAADLPPGVELTHDNLNTAIRDTYAAGYEPLNNLGQLTTGGVYRKALDKALTDFQGASRSFPDAAKPEVADLVNSYRVRSMDSGDAIKAISQLREGASAAYGQGKPEVAKASRAIADALENNIELNLTGQGREGSLMLDAFRNARQQLAKQYTVRDAIQEGTGSVNALKIATKLQRGKPLTDELATIGRFANTVPKMAAMPTAVSTPTHIGAIPTAVAGALGGPFAAGAVAGAPLVRAGVGSFLLSHAGQSLFGPSTTPSLLGRLGSPAVVRGLPSLFGQATLAAQPTPYPTQEEEIANGLYGNQ